MKTIWGISANSHDAALAVLTYNADLEPEIAFASHSERFSAIKNDPDLNPGIVAYARQNWGDPDRVVWYERPFKKSCRQLYAGQGWRFGENNVRQYLNHRKITAPVSTVDHHHSHAANGYYTSGFGDATVVVLDSIGEWETFTIWQGEGRDLKKVFSQRYPHSLGLWFSAMTDRIGLKAQEDEYILMGMAAYGDPKKYAGRILEDFFDADSVRSAATPEFRFSQNLHTGIDNWLPGLTEDDYPDVAAGVQRVYESVFKKIMIWCRANLSSQNLVLVGGCALNCSANRLIENFYDNYYIPPSPGDAGSAVGAALAYVRHPVEMPHPYLGYNIKRNYPVEAALCGLIQTGMVGIANGRAEFGPRALGNRSLLADPRLPDIKDQVNRVKQRQEFRPFAPAVLEEHASALFEGPMNRHMQYVARCRAPEMLPGVVHVDGTSRVQIVPKNNPGSPGFRTLLERWYAETGCPVLLNTSLNIKGYPIVNDERDALAFERFYGVKVY